MAIVYRNRRSLASLGMEYGLRTVSEVRILTYAPPGGFSAAQIFAEKRVLPNREVRVAFLWVCHSDWAGCVAHFGSDAINGPWRTSSRGLGEWNGWRITDKDWHIDVRLDGLSLDIAQRLVLALRSRTLIIPDHLSDDDRGLLKRVDLDRIESIHMSVSNRYPGEVPDTPSFIIRTKYSSFGGEYIALKLVEDGVYLLAVSSWIA